MITINDILDYSKKQDCFTCKQILGDMAAINKVATAQSIGKRLIRLSKEGLLKRDSWGLYSFSPRTFVPEWTEEMEIINQTILKSKPFLDFCVWDIMDLRRFSHHIGKQNIIFVDVMKDAEEGVFALLCQNHDIKRRVFILPSIDDYIWYVNDTPSIVVRTMITRAPLLDKRKTTLEKVMVDSYIDQDFFSFQGYELLRIYRNIYDLVDVNEKRLLAYASRRNKKSEIQNFLMETKEFQYD